jgi:hypothetical protein
LKGLNVNENILTWNFPNWVTITLMAGVGFLILAALAQVFHKARGGNSVQTAVGAVGG